MKRLRVSDVSQVRVELTPDAQYRASRQELLQEVIVKLLQGFDERDY
jgi:hypothetical protein